MMILGKKVKMTQLWQENRIVPVTVIHAEPNSVALVRTKERDGYVAAQIKLGKFKREARGTEASIGDLVTVAAFEPGELVKVAGLRKGRGFQGVVKRHGFAGGPKTHGQKNRLRAPGSIGATAPQRVVPGRRMAGRMGPVRISARNLKVVAVDAEKNLIMVRGSVPGAPGGLLEISKK